MNKCRKSRGKSIKQRKINKKDILDMENLNIRYRTDLAIENKEIAEESSKRALCEDDGIAFEKTVYDANVSASRITILDERGEKLLGKKRGTYTTIEVAGLLSDEEDVKTSAINAISTELQQLVKFHNKLKVLVIGLGNEKITPDSLGPNTVSKVMVTRHMFIIAEADSDEDISCVSGLSPGVTGTTGIETQDIIKKAAEITDPEVIIIIDSLAARNIERISTTIQMNDTGISPGAGIGNNRKELTEATLGRKVIAIGVPTVIDSTTLILDALHEFPADENSVDEYLKNNISPMIVTSTDIDLIIKEFSDIIAKGINITLHPGI